MATIALCILSYARKQQSNILQITTGYYAYADKTTKRMVEVLHWMGLVLTYKTIQQALQKNADAVAKELQKKAWKR